MRACGRRSDRSVRFRRDRGGRESRSDALPREHVGGARPARDRRRAARHAARPVAIGEPSSAIVSISRLLRCRRAIAWKTSLRGQNSRRRIPPDPQKSSGATPRGMTRGRWRPHRSQRCAARTRRASPCRHRRRPCGQRRRRRPSMPPPRRRPPRWHSRIVTLIEPNEAYPEAARRQKGVVQVAFSLDPAGTRQSPTSCSCLGMCFSSARRRWPLLRAASRFQRPRPPCRTAHSMPDRPSAGQPVAELK